MEKNGKRRMLSWLLAVILVFSLSPGNLFSPRIAKADDALTMTFDASAELGADGLDLAKSGAINADTTFADGFFTTFGSTKRANMDTYAIDIGKAGDAGLSFTIPATYKAKVTVSARGGGENKTATVVINDEAKEFDGKNVGDQVWEDLMAGSYTITSTNPNNVSGGSRITKVVVELVSLQKVFDAAAEFGESGLNLAKSDPITAGTTFADGFFTTFGSTKRANMNDYAIDLGKNGNAGLSFVIPEGYTASVTVAARGAGSTKVATVKIGEVEKDFDASTVEEKTWDGIEAGTCTVVSTDPNSVSGGARITKVVVDFLPAGTVIARKNWDEVSAPVITVEQDGKKVVVSYTMVIGTDGADTLEIYDASGEEPSLAKTIVSRGEEGTVEFTPAASGSYSYFAKAYRNDSGEGEEPVSYEPKTSETLSVDFVLPLGKTEIGVAYTSAPKTISLEWAAVAEAAGYKVEYREDGAEDWTTVDAGAELAAEISGLTTGATYFFRVVTLRGEESTTSEEVERVVSDEVQQKWGYIVYGNGGNSSNASVAGDVNEDGQVTLTSGKVDGTGALTGSGNNGKWQPAMNDGLNFYYYAVPSDMNFTLRAKVTVDQWFYSNGQEAIGVIANDALGGSGWNNSVSAAITKTEYSVVEETDDNGKVTGYSYIPKNTAYTSYNQKLGIQAQAKTGLSNDDLDEAGIPSTTKAGELSKIYAASLYPLEQRFNASGNLIGNCVNAASVESVQGANLTEMYMTIQRNNTGYFVTYETPDGSYSVTKKYYDRDALCVMDPDFVYVGFFTSRFAQATFSDVTFTMIDPAKDAPAEERPVEKVAVTAIMNSPEATGVAEYDFRFAANCDGSLTITDAEGKAVVTDLKIEADKPVVAAKTTLTTGQNKFHYVFTPDASYVPGEYMVMDSYEAISSDFVVTYKTYGNEEHSLFVAPNATGIGTRENPMSIYDAVKYVRPGQYIVIMEGTYLLSSTVKVDRGIDGTEDALIHMVVDPEAESRPVFDFQSRCAGMIFAGNYWYVQGFDVTGSGDGQKAIQLSGNNNVLDNINTYRNGSTGIQISRYRGSDATIETWPANNLVLNCTSYLNADSGQEDADGFAAKLTVGEGNVFDGCVAYNNADDGWDLYAKMQSGSIGAVTIRNCVAFGNGYMEDGNGRGNGNGFKMGGDSLSGKHVIENSVAFNNKAKGLDSNSCPDITVRNCTSFNNGNANVALYTNTAANTAFTASGVISYRNNSWVEVINMLENLKPKGTQVEADYNNETTYYWNGVDTSVNTAGIAVQESWFVSTDTKFTANFTFSEIVITRNADNTINMNGLLELTEAAPADAGARISGTASKDNSEVPDFGEEPDPSTFEIISGADQEIDEGSETEVEIEIDATFNLFKDVAMDGTTVDPKNYTAKAGSTIITFAPAYIKTLAAGTHTVSINFTDGHTVTTTLVVTGNNNSASTADMMPVILLVMLMAASLSLTLMRREKKS